MIKFILSLLVSLGLAAGYHILVFGNEITTRNTSDALFVVGLFLFFISLVAISDAAKVFVGFSYTFKNMFKRHREKYSNFYDYATQKENREGYFGVSTLIISIVFLTIAFVLAAQYFDSL